MIARTRSYRMFAWLLALGLCAASANAGLIHRYSFSEAKDGTVKDQAGSEDAKLKGGAKVEDGKAVLSNGDKSSGDASAAYVDLGTSIIPKGATSASVVIWFSAKDVGNFARLLDIGDQEGGEGRAFIYFTPRTADDQARAAITASDVSERIPLDLPRLDDGKPHMAAIVIDGEKKMMHVFVDGLEPSPAVSLDNSTLDKVKPAHAWIGRSGFDADPALSASIDEVRVYDNALTATEATAMNKAGADTLPAASPATQPAK